MREKLKTAVARGMDWLIDHLVGKNVHAECEKTVQAIREWNAEIARLKRELSKAENSLRLAGFTDNGGEQWKPPMNKRSGELLLRIFRLEEELEKYRSDSSRHHGVLSEQVKRNIALEDELECERMLREEAERERDRIRFSMHFLLPRAFRGASPEEIQRMTDEIVAAQKEKG
jgi:isochorismate synthase EntC